MEGRTHTLQELKEIGDHFDALDEKLSVWTREFMRSRGVGIDLLQTELATLLPGMKVPHDPKQIRKKVQVTGACGESATLSNAQLCSSQMSAT
jgi:hypothetical protein